MPLVSDAVEFARILNVRRRKARAKALLAFARLRYRNPEFPAAQLSRHLAAATKIADAALLEGIVQANIEAHGAEAVAQQTGDALERLGPHRKAMRKRLVKTAFAALLSADEAQAILFGNRWVDAVEDKGIAIRVARATADGGAIERPLQLLERFGQAALRPDRKVKINKLRDQATLLHSGYPLPAPATKLAPDEANRRVLYVLSQSLPHHSSGYAVRSHGLLRQLQEAGWDVSGVTRFGYPNDRHDFRAKQMVGAECVVDEVRYQFTPDVWGFRAVDTEYIARATQALVERARPARPAIIHAASNYQVGLAGIAAARTLGVPSIYEVRGLWHMSRTAVVPDYEVSEHYRMSERLEVEAAQGADRVLVITQAVLDLLADRGVERSKMTLLPNAVAPDEFHPRPREEALAAELGLAGRVVIGCIGTFKSYEGLDLLLEATAQVRRSVGDTFGVLLVGDGPDTERLKRRRDELGLGDMVVMTGRVPHERVADYYSIIDICAYPRTSTLVCRYVSPLKPLEAMVMEKAIVASDVAALAEMVEHEKTGLLHRADDAGSLAAALTRLIQTPALRSALGQRARRYVTAHRSWRQVSATVAEVYQELLDRYDLN